MTGPEDKPAKDKSIKDVEEEMERTKERAKILEKQIEEAEAKHPPKLDHPEGGGTF